MSGRLGDDPLSRAKTFPSHSPYNSVFFERRASKIELVAESPALSVEPPEISEVSEIPEIREAATVPPQPVESPPTSPPTEVTEAAPAPEPSFIQEVVASFNATASASTFQPDPPTETLEKPVSVVVESDGVPGEALLSQDTGFFKRLFGKLGR